MGFLDRISETISETGQDIKRKADQSSAKSQMNSELRRREKELEGLVYQIGFEMVSNHPEVCGEKCPELYNQLVNTREAAKDLRNRIALTEVEILCPGCGRVVKGAAPFCTYCGTRLPEPNLDPNAEYAIPGGTPVIQNQSGEICPTCGAPLKVGAAFCVNCGTPVAQQAPAAAPVAAPAEAQPEPQMQQGTRTCKTCGAELDADDVFCTNCGTPV